MCMSVVSRTSGVPCCRDVRGSLWVPRTGIRVGIRVGYTGVIPSHRALRSQGAPHPAERAPEGLQGLEWVGGVWWDRPLRVSPLGASARPRPHPPGPVSPCRASLGRGPAPRAKGRDSMTYSLKLVKRRECHRNILKRPVIVPIPKTASRNHLLKFSDFHIG